MNRQSGGLTEIAGSPFPSPGVPVVDPGGKFLLAFSPADIDRGTLAKLFVLSIDDATGALSQVGTPVPTVSVRYGPLPVFSADSKFVFVCGYSAIQIFSFDPTTGLLTETATSPFHPAGGDVGSLAVVGEFLVASASADAVAVYSINAASGDLTPVSGSPFPIGRAPTQVTIHPSGKFVYAITYGPAPGFSEPPMISALTIDASTGSVAVAPGSPAGIGTGTPSSEIIPAPPRLAVTPSGNLLYARSVTYDSIFGYRVDLTSGSLAAIDGSPFPVDSPNFSIAIVSRQTVSP